MEWYYVANNAQAGPVGDADLANLVKSGVITPDTLVWHAGMSDWQPYRAVSPPSATAAHAPGRPETGICCECRQVFPQSEMIQYEDRWVCARCKPVFFQRLREGAELPGTMVYAGFWIRFAAKFIDWLIIGAANMILSLALTPLIITVPADPDRPLAVIGFQLVLSAVQLTLAVAFSTFFLGRFGATPGKMACRLRVLRSSGDPISYWRAFGRHFAEMLSQILLYIGYIMAAFDEEKRALHDRICDTRVVRTDT